MKGVKHWVVSVRWSGASTVFKEALFKLKAGNLLASNRSLEDSSIETEKFKN